MRVSVCNRRTTGADVARTVEAARAALTSNIIDSVN